MKQYWPMAKIKGCHSPLYTTIACKDIHECAEIFRNWDNILEFEFTELWVDVFDTEDENYKGKYEVKKDFIFTEI